VTKLAIWQGNAFQDYKTFLELQSIRLKTLNQMLCLDKLKIITSINFIKDIDENVFHANSMSGILQYHKYQQKKPFSLLIMNNYEKNELVIEFTSKILKNNFIHLITKETIYECFHNINQLGICKLDIDNIINYSEVVKCDPAKDVIFYESMKALKNHTNSNFSNYDKWKSKSYLNGFTVENTASTPRNKHRIVVYGKAKELAMEGNQSFIDSLSDKEKCLSHYEDKIRIELNINTKPQIRELLSISDNQLMNVLNSEENPILTVLNKAIKGISVNTHAIRTFKEYQLDLGVINK
jgi:hypothetical protein